MMAPELVTVRVSRETWERLQHIKIKQRARSLATVIDLLVTGKVKAVENSEKENIEDAR